MTTGTVEGPLSGSETRLAVISSWFTGCSLAFKSATAVLAANNNTFIKCPFSQSQELIHCDVLQLLATLTKYVSTTDTLRTE